MSVTQIAKAVGTSIRSLGKATDALGVLLEGNLSYTEKLNPATNNVSYNGKSPSSSSDCFIAPNASVIGSVKVGAKSSIWYSAILRGDINNISIGENSNIQDGAVVHVAGIASDISTSIGDNVTIGPLATVHACTIEDDCIVGTSATILDGAIIKKNSMVAAGSLVTKGKVIGSGQLWSGIPAKFLRNLTEDELAFINECADDYYKLSQVHKLECQKSFREIEEEKNLAKGLTREGDIYDTTPRRVEKGGDGLIFKD